MTNIKQ